MRHPDDLARFLLGWSTVWHAARGAAAGAGISRTARDELLTVASQSISWLETDLSALTDLLARDIGCGAAATAGWSGGAEDLDGAGERLAQLLTRPEGGWGVGYVLLGSRLGGGVLGPPISAALALPAGVGTRFLGSAGTSPGRDLAAFKVRLDGSDLTDAELAGAVDAARWTFGWVGTTLARARSGCS